MNNPEFEKISGHKFKDAALLNKALTHSSYIKVSKSNDILNNERLEFLGDAFFDAIVSEELYKRLENVEEGVLTKIRAKIVCERSLASLGMSLNVGKYINMGKGEEMSGGRSRESIIADAVEAVIGAIFLDGGYDAAKRFVLSKFGTIFDDALSGRLHIDYKSEIQEKVQIHGKSLQYNLVDQEGPDHDKTFFVELVCDKTVIGKGQGKSKKEAERNAAKQALERGEDLAL
ncbi:MAG: ribonuclease III [Eubacteriales bacterium]|nr:ribonuclease III [Eubacteriales bacterium]MDD4389539.1 ribonuclease III [Eubacteriales bacterium]